MGFSKSGVARTSISLPPELLRNLDEIVQKLGYDRSKLVQMAIRNIISEMEWLQSMDVEGAGALLTLYDHTVKGAEEALTDLQHEHREIIQGAFHIHLDDKNCLEIIFVRGGLQLIKSLLQRVEGLRSVKQVKASIITAKSIES